jgi:hypothetical protein
MKSTNSLQLYVDNILITTQTASTSLTSLACINYVTIDSCFDGYGTCNSGSVTSGQFVDAGDDIRIYIGELTVDDVLAVYAYRFA